MKTNDDRDWRNLCEQVAKETDHNKLMELAEKINEVLEQRERNLRRPIGTNSPSNQDGGSGAQ